MQIILIHKNMYLKNFPTLVLFKSKKFFSKIRVEKNLYFSTKYKFLLPMIKPFILFVRLNQNKVTVYSHFIFLFTAFFGYCLDTN